VEDGFQHALRRGAGWLMGALLLTEAALLVGRRMTAGPETAELTNLAGNTQQLGQALYTRYLFPFEITSILLLVAMVGVIVIARGRTRAGAERAVGGGAVEGGR